MYALRTGRPLPSGPINTPSPPRPFHTILTPKPPLFALRLPVGRFMSVCEVSVLPEEGTLEVLLQGGNARFP
jgi:hypothetical protein